MSMMNAAVVTSFAEPPHYQPFEVPTVSAGEILVDVLAAGLHPRVRSGAAGQHYTSSGTLPMIPGDNPGYLSMACWIPDRAASIAILLNDEVVNITDLLRQLLPAALEP
jgi:hypothetical protein